MAKFYTKQKHREAMNALDMLNGCINHICLTDDDIERDRMFASAMQGIFNLTDIHIEKILERTYGEKEIRDANQAKLSNIIFDKTINDDTREQMIKKLSAPISVLEPTTMARPTTLREHIKYLGYSTDVDEIRQVSTQAVVMLLQFHLLFLKY